MSASVGADRRAGAARHAGARVDGDDVVADAHCADGAGLAALLAGRVAVAHRHAALGRHEDGLAFQGLRHLHDVDEIRHDRFPPMQGVGLHQSVPDQNGVIGRGPILEHFQLFRGVRVDEAAAHRLGFQHARLRELQHLHVVEERLGALLAAVERAAHGGQASHATIHGMEGLVTVLIHRHHHVGARLVHGQRLRDHQRRAREHHVARHHGHVGVARSLQRRVQPGQRATVLEGVAHQLDAQVGEFSMQKHQVVRLVRGDDQVVGHRAQPVDQAADERAPRERHRRLAAPHAPAFAARLDDHRDARPHVVLLHEVGQPDDVVECERRDVVQFGGMFGHRHVGGYRHRVARGQLIGYVHVVGMLRLEMLARRLPFPRLGRPPELAQPSPRLVVVGPWAGRA